MTRCSLAVGKVRFMELVRGKAKLRGDDLKLKEFTDAFMEAGMIPRSLMRREMNDDRRRRRSIRRGHEAL